jgi:acetylornithine/N-succinyldiaminopimelate aminotransferase
MLTAKAVGGGVPVGAFLLGEKAAANSLVAGDHGTTYGGNPLACAAVKKTLDLFEENHIIEHVNSVGKYLEEALNKVADAHACITMRRGKGLMQGLAFDKPVANIIKNAIEKGLLLISAGTDVIRFLPPLIITKEDVDVMIGILEEAIKEDE